MNTVAITTNNLSNGTPKTVNFYEGSYLFDSTTTGLNIMPDYVQYVLAKQYEYRPTKEDLWATIVQDGKELVRYSFDYNEGLTEIVFDRSPKQ
jgi:hypothetical protein